MEATLFNKGIRPAVNVGISVSRVGSAAQTNVIKKLSGSLKLELAQYREVESFATFGSDLDSSTKKILDKGSRLIKLYIQPHSQPLSIEILAVLLYVAQDDHLRDIPVENIILFLKYVVWQTQAVNLITVVRVTDKEVPKKLLFRFITIIKEEFLAEVNKV